MTVVALAMLALRDRAAAGWLAVPAAWPASQLHYSTMALPVMTPLLAFFLAIPILRLPPEIILVEIVRRLVRPPAWPGSSPPGGPSPDRPARGLSAGGLSAAARTGPRLLAVLGGRRH